ncbi:DNA mismatch repair endonuclease MutL [Lottiidibacillus patelloidae]|uniref:DNA mismatch repair protein MutL n=1 Tax=Lottiidibacillus patelloidae TaxID=2670334 RepID=A0A263BY63_9BACI|nr:DNA mismatch repair endonuclease MutL [Lottiidibacillus patelloidae]OZM58655.1 DNA mismatch repair endonuclease MutL [Lottiidibacillus patelloidae]
MGKIVRLNEQLSNLIAAGEVVERPASVVKELVENAIDANSTRIEVEVEEGGLSKIRILDNGTGIASDDCEVAFERHATSKIKNERDLFRIKSLGFRGEALPSIASVSDFHLKTSTGDGPGTYVHLQAGSIKEKTAANSRKGTEITVNNLFFNTPARLKYMKTVHTELGNITDVINRLAMAHPTIAFKLTHNEKQVLATSGNGDLRQVIAAIYGMQVAKNLLPIKAESIDFSISGWIAKPEVTRASRNYMSTIVNGRYIRNYQIMRAVQEGFHTLLPIGRYPIALLHIEMDPLLIDVNVHPSKLEVRLSKEKELTALIQEAIKAELKKTTLIPSAALPRKEKDKSEQQQMVFNHTVPKQSDALKQVDQPANYYRFSETESVAETLISKEAQPALQETKHYDNSPIVEEERLQTPFKEEATISSQSGEGNEQQEEGESRLPPLYPIGQMHGTYILAQNDNGLYLIDQHAAQERIKYEYFREKVGEIEPELQELLVPLTFEFTGAEMPVIEENIDKLKDVGIFLEPFGHQAFMVNAHPLWFPEGQEKEIIEEMIEEILKQKTIDVKKLREEAAIMMSCKASIKANRHLRNDEIFSLLETLRKSSDPFTCPHGRPITIHYSTYEMEKMFKRIM